MDSTLRLIGMIGLVLLAPISWRALDQMFGDVEASDASARQRSAEFVRVAEEALGDGQDALAIVAYQNALDMQPDAENVRIPLLLAQCRVLAREPTQMTLTTAREIQVRIRAHGLTVADAPEVGLVSALTDIMEGRPSLGHADIEKTAQAHSGSALAQFVLGESRHARGNETGAIDAYKRAAKIDPENARFHAILGQRFHSQGKWERAESTLEEAIDRGASGRTRLLYGEALLKLNKTAQAIDSLTEAVSEMSDKRERARAQAALGVALYRIGRPGQALNPLMKAYAATEDEQILLNIGRSYQALEQHDKASQVFRKALLKRPQDGENHLLWLSSLMALGRKVTAAQVYDRMVPVFSPLQDGSAILARARKITGLPPGE